MSCQDNDMGNNNNINENNIETTMTMAMTKKAMTAANNLHRQQNTTRKDTEHTTITWP